ncbi:reverse transcriptase domain-containing protein [Tanacetum coccineum]
MPLRFGKNFRCSELLHDSNDFRVADPIPILTLRVSLEVSSLSWKFTFRDFEAGPRSTLILGRAFLKTGRTLIDVYEGEITLRVDNEAVTFNLDQTMKYSSTNDKSVNRIDIIGEICEEYIPELSGFPNDGRFLSAIHIESDAFTSECYFEEIDAYLLWQMQSLWKVIMMDCDPEETFIASGIGLKDGSLPSHLEYAFLEENDKLPVIIAKGLKNDQKEALINVLKSHKRAIAWKITDIKGIDPRFCTHKILMEDDCKPSVQSQRRVNPKIHEVIKKEVIKLLDAGMIYPISDSPWIPIDPQDQEKTTFTCPYGTFAYRHRKTNGVWFGFMDDFFVFGDNFDSCLSNLERMLKRCEDTNLVLNWEKCHFMCKEGIVLGHKISKSGIEVDRAKVDVIAKLPHLTTVKGVRSFLGHAGFYRRFIQDFSKISRPITHLLEKDTPFVFSQDCINAFETLKKKLTEAPILVVPDWNLPFELMCDASDLRLVAGSWTTYRLPPKRPVGQVKVSNRGLKRILERTVGENRASWSDKLDDALCENSLIYKEKTKKLHDSKIKNRIFNVGDQVLLFNSRLKIFSGKLKSRWSGPFTITEVYPYGTAKLSHADGSNFKVNCHRLKHYYGGDTPPLVIPDLQTFPKDN